jgi:hypothetical protein
MKILRAITLLLLLISCNSDKRKQVELDEFAFKITNDSGLFFKNVRQLYYDFQEIPLGSNRFVYRLKNRSKSDEEPVLYPTIMINWLNDQANILIEVNEYPEIPLTLNVKINCEEKEDIFIVLDERGRENMLDFANKIYDALIASCNLSLEINQEFIPLMRTEKSRIAFKKTMQDYYALVRLK